MRPLPNNEMNPSTNANNSKTGLESYSPTKGISISRHDMQGDITMAYREVSDKQQCLAWHKYTDYGAREKEQDTSSPLSG